MGAQGIFVPNIDSRADAEAAVRHAKFHPAGRRGLGPYGRWARQRPGGTPLPEFVRQANGEIMVTLLVESVQGVECLDEILGVEGVDEIHLGLADLSQSLGRPGDVGSPEVLACTTQALAKILRAGRTAGMGAASPERVRQFLDQGVRSVLVGADMLFVDAGRRFVNEAGIE
jgi:4-hydroxy-2-oxoheptanedioate aldolase